MFEPGDKVLRQQKVISKIAPQADGPYEVKRISGIYR